MFYSLVYIVNAISCFQLGLVFLPLKPQNLPTGPLEEYSPAGELAMAISVAATPTISRLVVVVES